MITSSGLNEMANAILDLVQYCRIQIGGAPMSLPIHTSNVTGSIINIFFLVGEGITGQITSAELISITNNVLDIKPHTISKASGGGLIIRFSITISEI